MLTVPSGQAQHLRAGALAPLVAVHLEVFSDYSGELTAAEYYWTRGEGFSYTWNGVARWFDPVIESISPIVRAIENIPNGSSIDSRRTTLEVVLGNVAPSGNGSPTLWEELRALNLQHARLTIGSLAVDIRRRMGLAATEPWDFSDLSLQHITRFRGELTAIGRVTEESIPLTFEEIEPDLDWPVASEVAEVDPRDLGKRYPMVVGYAQGIPAIKRIAGAVTTLAEAIDTVQTGSIEVGDSSRFPTISEGGAIVQVGSERLAGYQHASDPTLFVVTGRGIASTSAAAHNLGDQVFEVTDTTLVLAGHQSDGVDALYYRHPVTDELVRIPSSLYAVTLANTALEAGRTLTTVLLTEANLQTLYDALASGGAAAVSQQPDFEIDSASSGYETVQIPFTTISQTETGLDPGASPYTPDGSDLLAIDAEVLAASLSETPSETDAIHGWIGAVTSGSRAVRRFRVVLRVNYEADSTNDFQLVGSFDFYGEGGYVNVNVTAGGGEVLGAVLTSAWETPTGVTVDDLIRSSAPSSASDPNFLSFFIDVSGALGVSAYAAVLFGQSYVEIELEPLALVRTNDVEVTGGLAFAAEVQYVADVRGFPIPASSGYLGTAGDPVEHPADVVKWFVQTHQVPSLVDTSTYPAGGIGTEKLSGDLRVLGLDFGEIVAQLLFHCRMNLVLAYESGITSGHVLQKLYGFDDDPGWSTSPSGDAINLPDPPGSVGFRPLETDYGQTLWTDADEASEWSALSSSTVSDDTGIEVDGSSIKVDNATGSDAAAQVSFSSRDLSGRHLLIDFYLDGDTPTAGLVDLLRIILEDGSAVTGEWSFALAEDAMSSEEEHASAYPFQRWVSALFTPDDLGGGFDPTDVVRLEVRAQPPQDVEYLTDFDDASDWWAGNGDSVNDDGTINHDGTNAVRADDAADAADNMQAEMRSPPGGGPFSPTYDWSGDVRLRFWFRWTSDADLSHYAITRLRFYVWQGGAANIFDWQLTDLAKDTWHNLELRPDIGAHDASAVDEVWALGQIVGDDGTVGTYASIWIDEMRLTGASGTGDRQVYIDRVRDISSGYHDEDAADVIPSEDWTSSNGLYRAYFKVTRTPMEIVLWWSDAASGSPPANRYELEATGLTDQWTLVEATPTTVGSPTVTAIRSIGLRMRWGSGPYWIHGADAGPFPRINSFAMVDFLQHYQSLALPGPAYDFSGPETDDGFGSASRTIDRDQRAWTESRKAASELATRFEAVYAHDSWRGDLRALEAYREVARIGSDASDLPALTPELTAAEVLRGRRTAERLPFPMIRDAATLLAVFGYYAKQALRDAARFSCEVPWELAYDLQPGDRVDATRPAEGATAVPCRVTLVPFTDESGAIGINLEEVEE